MAPLLARKGPDETCRGLSDDAILYFARPPRPAATDSNHEDNEEEEDGDDPGATAAAAADREGEVEEGEEAVVPGAPCFPRPGGYLLRARFHPRMLLSLDPTGALYYEDACGLVSPLNYAPAEVHTNPPEDVISPASTFNAIFRPLLHYRRG